MEFLPTKINLSCIQIHASHQGPLHFTRAVVKSVESARPSDGNYGHVTPDFHPSVPLYISYKKKNKKPIGLHSNSVWGLCKSLGFSHLLTPNPFSLFQPP